LKIIFGLVTLYISLSRFECLWYPNSTLFFDLSCKCCSLASFGFINIAL